jgi:hypothetical protein
MMGVPKEVYSRKGWKPTVHCPDLIEYGDPADREIIQRYGGTTQFWGDTEIWDTTEEKHVCKNCGRKLMRGTKSRLCSTCEYKRDNDPKIRAMFDAWQRRARENTKG